MDRALAILPTLVRKHFVIRLVPDPLPSSASQGLDPDTDSDDGKGKNRANEERDKAHSDDDDDDEADVQEVPLSGARTSFQLDEHPRSPSDDEHEIHARSPPRDIHPKSPAIEIHPKSPSFHARSRTPSDDGSDIQDVPLSASSTRPSFSKTEALPAQHDSDEDQSDDAHHTIPLSASSLRPSFAKGLSLGARHDSDDEHDAPLSARPGQTSFNIPLSARPGQTSFGNLPSPPAGGRDSRENSPPFRGQDSYDHDLTPPISPPTRSPEVSDDESDGDDVQEIPLSPNDNLNRFAGIPLEIPSGKMGGGTRDFNSISSALSAADKGATPTNQSLPTPTTQSLFGALRSPSSSQPAAPPSPPQPQTREIESKVSPPSPVTPKAPTPPTMTRGMSDMSDTVSVTSTTSSARKARPDSVVIDASGGPLILGIAVVDFNHIVSSFVYP